MSVTVPVTHDVPSHSHSQYPSSTHHLHPEHDPNLLYPPQRRSPLPRSPLAAAPGGHSPSRSPSGNGGSVLF